MASDRRLTQFLELLQSSGITHLPRVTLPKATSSAVRRPATQGTVAATPVIKALAAESQSSPRTSAVVSQISVVPEPLLATEAVLSGTLETAAQKADALCQLAGVVAGCRRCSELAETRRQTVFGVGAPDAEIMFIGEAPGADEDKRGEPFVGAAGQLLDKIIEASGLKREELYICNILRCRPPGNRTPHPQEAANCREFLDGQIRIVDPDYIICWGTVAAQNLLQEKRPVGKLRGKFFSYGRATVMCTYHPSYLLRAPAAKKDVWADMKLFLSHRAGGADK